MDKTPGQILDNAADWIEEHPDRLITGEFVVGNCYCLLGRVCVEADVPPMTDAWMGNWMGALRALGLPDGALPQISRMAMAFDRAADSDGGDLTTLLHVIRNREAPFDVVPAA